MPLVLVKRSLRIDNDDFKRICHELPQIVAKHLTCDDLGGELSAGDVEVWVIGDQDFGFLAPAFSAKEHPCEVIGGNDLQIIIFAADFVIRKANLNDRKIAIINSVKNILPPEIHGFLWILLAPSSFGEF